MTGKVRQQRPVTRQMSAQQPLLPLSVLLVMGRHTTAVVRQQLPSIEDEQIDARVVMHEQPGECALNIGQGGRAHAGLPGCGNAQLESAWGTCGNTQLRCAQARQRLGAGLAGIEHEHQANLLDPFDTTGRHNQSLNQQLQRGFLRLRQMFKQSLQYLLIYKLHGLIVNTAHNAHLNFSYGHLKAIVPAKTFNQQK
ncbi:hypothetical protein D3C84_650320 [compost metagenome]